MAGFTPVRYRDGTPYTGAAQRCSYITAADLYVGDVVSTSGTADATGVMGVSLTGETAAVYGIVVGFEPIVSDLTANYITSAQATGDGAFVLVATDKNIVFEVKEDGGGAFNAAVDVGLNTNSIDGGAVPAYGESGAVLDSSDKATTATLQFKLLGLAQTPDNAFGDSDTVWEVTINQSSAHSLGTLGIS
jgi:hypothetical protein